MSDLSSDLPNWRGGWFNRLVASRKFQSWASKFPLTRSQARADGAALFDIVQGFVQSQTLFALVELQIFERLRGGPLPASVLASALDIEERKLELLLQSGAALGLLKRGKGAKFGLARKGAALMGVPGLADMIRHHRAFYRDLEDPVALLRGPQETELSKFWPYVFGANGDVPGDVAETYSDLMTRSQALVAEDTLRKVDFSGIETLLDVGGGTGAFLSAVGAAYPKLNLHLFDLPQVVPQANQRFEAAGQAGRAQITPGSFRTDTLPSGADAISLIRVLYDHEDSTIQALLKAVFDTLPKGGRLIISEPMGGGDQPDRTGDVYFAFYTLAMQTGRARSAEQISKLCQDAGFVEIHSPKPLRPFVTRTLTAKKPD